MKGPIYIVAYKPGSTRLHDMYKRGSATTLKTADYTGKGYILAEYVLLDDRETILKPKRGRPIKHVRPILSDLKKHKRIMFNEEKVHTILSVIKEVLEPGLKQFRLQMFELGEYNSDEFSVTLTFTNLGEEDRREELVQVCIDQDINPNIFNEEITYKGQTYRVVGANKRQRHEPFLVMHPDGSIRKCSVALIKKALPKVASITEEVPEDYDVRFETVKP